jgi:hypothetical protein
MHSLLLMTTAAFLVTANGNAADAPAAGASSHQSAAWVTRKIDRFSPPDVYVPANGYETNTRSLSCDQIIDRARFLLEQLGAREISFDSRECITKQANELRMIDITFSALQPSGPAAAATVFLPVAAQWQTVALKGNGIGDCAFLNYVTRKVLPALATRNVKLIPTADCQRIGVGLYAQILKATKQ